MRNEYPVCRRGCAGGGGEGGGGVSHAIPFRLLQDLVNPPECQCFEA